MIRSGSTIRTSVFEFTICLLEDTPFIITKPQNGYVVSANQGKGNIPFEWSINVPSCMYQLYGAEKIITTISFDEIEQPDIIIPTSGTNLLEFTFTDRKIFNIYYRITTPVEVKVSDPIHINVCDSIPPSPPSLSYSVEYDSMNYIQTVDSLGNPKSLIFTWSPPDLGISCSSSTERSSNNKRYVAILFDSVSSKISEKVVDEEFAPFSFITGGLYSLHLKTYNGERYSPPHIMPLNVCVQKRPPQFSIIYPQKEKTKLSAKHPVIKYEQMEMSDDCSNSGETHRIYVEKDGNSPVDITDLNNKKDNYFDKNLGNEYCVFVRKTNGKLTRDSRKVCFSLCNENVEVSYTINVELSETYSSWGYFEFTWDAGGQMIGQEDACGNKPYIGYIVTNSETGYYYESPYNDKSRIALTLPQTGIYAFKFYTTSSNGLEDVLSKSVNFCKFASPSATTIISPENNEIIPLVDGKASVTIKVKKISDWGNSCGKFIPKKIYRYHVSDIKKYSTETEMTIEITHEGSYTVYVVVHAGVNDGKEFSVSSEQVTFRVCAKKSPKIGSLSISNNTLDVDLNPIVEVAMAEAGQECITKEGNYFILQLHRYSESTNIEEIGSGIATEILSRRSQMGSFKLSMLSSNRVHRIDVFAYTANGVAFDSVSVYFKTRTLWCNPSPCVNGICNEFVRVCECSKDYSGRYCDKLITNSMIPVFIVIPVTVIIVTAIVLFVIWKRSRNSKLPAKNLTKYMFVMPRDVHSYGDSKKSVDEVFEILCNDQEGQYTNAITLLKCTPATDFDSISRSLIYAFERNGNSLNFLLSLIDYEIDVSTTPEELFGRTSFAARCFKHYVRMIGLPYLYRVVYPLVNKLDRENQKDESITLKESPTENAAHQNFDPTERQLINSDENFAIEMEHNGFLLQVMCEYFFRALSSTESYCPPELKIIVKEIKKEGESKISPLSC